MLTGARELVASLSPYFDGGYLDPPQMTDLG